MKANGKLTENTGTECERDLIAHYFRWAKKKTTGPSRIFYRRGLFHI
jgi:hypothetical protein